MVSSALARSLPGIPVDDAAGFVERDRGIHTGAIQWVQPIVKWHQSETSLHNAAAPKGRWAGIMDSVTGIYGNRTRCVLAVPAEFVICTSTPEICVASPVTGNEARIVNAPPAWFAVKYCVNSGGDTTRIRPGWTTLPLVS